MTAHARLRRIARYLVGDDHPADLYFNPRLTAAEERTLLRRNYLLLQTGQAALGLIGPDILGIAVEPRPDDVILHFAVAEHTEQVAQDIQDIADDLVMLLNPGPEMLSTIDTQIHVGRPATNWPGRTHALLYIAKRPNTE